MASNAEGRARGLEEFRFQVETRDWHVNQMTLSFDDATFQIDEENSSVLDRRDVPADVLTRLESAEPEQAAVTADVPTAPRNVLPGVNIDDLEMTVRSELHQVGADLGDSIEITPRPPNELIVNAWGVSSQRREQLAALLANKPGIQLEFQAPADSRRRGGSPIKPVGPTTSQPQDNRLAGFFGSADAEENYTRGVLQASTDLLAHLYALQQLAVRWPPGHESELSDTAKAQLAAMVRDHARDVQARVGELKPQVDFLLKGFGYATLGEPSAGGGANWQGASAATLEKAQATDQILRSLLTTSEAPMSVDEALPKLKQSFEELEVEARELVRGVQ